MGLGGLRSSGYLVKVLIAAGAATALAAIGVIWVSMHRRTAPPAPLYLVVRLRDPDPETQRYLREITKPTPTPVLPGEDFRSVVSRHYGYISDELTSLVRAANPGLSTLSAGEHVLLPAAPRYSHWETIPIEHTEPTMLLRQLAELKTGTSGETTRRAVEAANPSLQPDAWDKPVRGSVTIPLSTFDVKPFKTSSLAEAKLEVSRLTEMSHSQVPVAEVTTGYRVVPNWTLASAASTGAGSPRAPKDWPFQTLPDISKIVQDFTDTATIAVVDTGIAQFDRTFDKVLWNNPSPGTKETLDRTETPCINDYHGCNFMTFNSFPEDDCQVPADYNHGTHVAGLVSARLSQAKDVLNGHLQLMVLKVADSTGQIDPGKLALAIRYATKHDANIVNLSLIGEGDDNVKYAIRDAKRQSLFVAAAGNCTSKGCQGQDLKDGKAGDPVVPAIMSSDPDCNVITVAAQAEDPIGGLSSFSNFGKTLVDLAAPGSEVTSTVSVSGGNIRSESGTSQATALVSLAAALLYAEGLKDPSVIKNRLIASSDYHKVLQEKILSGGSLNIKKALLYGQDLVQLKDGTLLQGTITFPLKIDVDDGCNEPDPLALRVRVKKIALHTTDDQMSRVMYIKNDTLVSCDGANRISRVTIKTANGSQNIAADRIAEIIPAIK